MKASAISTASLMPAAMLLTSAGFSGRFFPSLQAHHGAEGGAGEIVSTGSAIYGNPRSFFTVQEDWIKGSQPDIPEPIALAGRNITPVSPPRNLQVTTFFFEHAFHKAFSLNLMAPVVRYDQKGAPDYARVGNVFIGFRIAPILLVKTLFQSDEQEEEDFLSGQADTPSPFFLTFDGRLGLPAGSDAQVATRTDFWQGALAVTGGYSWKYIRLIGRAEGQWPLSKLERPEEPSSLEKFAALLNGQILGDETASNFVLKKSTLYSGTVYFYPFDWMGLFTGMLYQAPFAGVIYDRRRPYPRIYRETQAGLTLRPSEHWIFLLAYHYPLERGRDRRRMDESYTASLTYFL